MRGYVPDQMPLRDDALNRTSAYRAPLVWRVPEGPGISVGQRSNTRNHAGPDCGAGGRWQGLEGYRDEAPNVSEHQVPLVWRVPEGRDCGAGGRWQGLAGLRDDAPSEARGADGSRAGRRPPAHQAARPSRHPGTPKGRVPKYPPLTQPLPRRGSGRMILSPGDGDASTGTCRQRRPLPGQHRRSGRRSRCGRGPSSAWWPGRRARRNRSSRR